MADDARFCARVKLELRGIGILDGWLCLRDGPLRKQGAACAEQGCEDGPHIGGCVGRDLSTNAADEEDGS